MNVNDRPFALWKSLIAVEIYLMMNRRFYEALDNIGRRNPVHHWRLSSSVLKGAKVAGQHLGKETSVPNRYIDRIRFATSAKASFRLVQSVSISLKTTGPPLKGHSASCVRAQRRS